MAGKALIFSAPSGSGKSTVVGHILKRHPEIEFSVSATSRPPRGTERDGVEYHFLSPEKFRSLVDQDQFVEWEEVYGGSCYGTLKSEVERIWAKGHVIIFDVDVKGALNIKKLYGQRSLAIFIQPPSIAELRRRLEGRGTDTPEVIEQRLAKAEYELSFASQFDEIVINDNLEVAQIEAESLIEDFLNE